jgi:hypothetical protein
MESSFLFNGLSTESDHVQISDRDLPTRVAAPVLPELVTLGDAAEVWKAWCAR